MYRFPSARMQGSWPSLSISAFDDLLNSFASLVFAVFSLFSALTPSEICLLISCALLIRLEPVRRDLELMNVWAQPIDRKLKTMQRRRKLRRSQTEAEPRSDNNNAEAGATSLRHARCPCCQDSHNTTKTVHTDILVRQTHVVPI